MKLRDINNKALYQHGGPNHFLRAALSHWEAQRDEAVATLELYFNGSVGIGEHSEILAEINKWTEKLSQADENIASLKGYFQTTFTGHVEIIDDDEPIEKELLKGNE